MFFPEANAVFWNSLYLPRGFLWIKATALLVILSLASVPDITLKVIDAQLSSIMMLDTSRNQVQKKEIIFPTQICNLNS